MSPGAGKPQQVAELLFGRKIGDRLGVSRARLGRRFVDREITPAFSRRPYRARRPGQWRDPRAIAIVREPSKVVQIVLPGQADDMTGSTRSPRPIRPAFGSSRSAVIVRDRACVSF